MSRDWGATHVLSYEKDGRMVEELVRQDRDALYTVQEWTGRSLADWTLERGQLCYCGEDVPAASRWSLRAIPPPRLRLEQVLEVVERGVSEPGEVARLLGRGLDEVSRKLTTLSRLGKLKEKR